MLKALPLILALLILGACEGCSSIASREIQTKHCRKMLPHVDKNGQVVPDTDDDWECARRYIWL